MFNRTALRSFFAKTMGAGTLLNDFFRFATMTCACLMLGGAFAMSQVGF